MNGQHTTARVAAVLAVSAVAGACAGSNPAGPSTPAPASAPPAASISPALDYGDQPGEGTLLEPGTYVTTSASPFRIAFTVPAGWYKGTIEWAVWENDSNSSIAFEVPENLYIDPCVPGSGLRDPAVGPTVADLVAALGSVPGASAGAASDVTVAGFRGKRIDFTAAEPAACDEAALWDIDGAEVPLPGPGEELSMRILDAGGVRLVVSSRTRPGIASDAVSEIEDIVDSIQIDGP